MAYSKNDVIELCRSVHGEKYDYSITNGVQNKLGKIQYICPLHGVQTQILSNHLQGKGCKHCANLERQKKHTPSIEEFLSKAKSKNIPIDNYDWSNFNLLRRDDQKRVEFYCKKHGAYWDWPSNFLRGHGCHVCYGKAKDDTEVRQQLAKLHPELDFSQTKYSEHDELYRIKVICPKHGEQYIGYYNLLNGQGCYWCGREKTGNKTSITNEEFIRRGVALFGNRYTYEKLDMRNRDDDGRVIVTCSVHGDFKVWPSNFYKGVGCPLCKESSLENVVRQGLEQNGINYVYQCGQRHFFWLEKLKLDFYLPQYSIAIECQGAQHFHPVSIFGGDASFVKQIKADKKKYIRCQEHGIKLLYFAEKNYTTDYDLITNIDTLMQLILESDRVLTDNGGSK